MSIIQLVPLKMTFNRRQFPADHRWTPCDTQARDDFLCKFVTFNLAPQVYTGNSKI